MKKILLAIVICFAFGNASQAAITLPQVNGWTVFTPSDDSRICYVSAVDSDGTGTAHDDDDAVIGSDPFNPTGDVDEFPTYAAARAATRDGYPDWILFKRGETFSAQILPRSGRDADEFSLVGAYGASGALPVIHPVDDASPVIYYTGEESGGYMAFINIYFYANTRDPDGGVYDGVAGAPGIQIQISNTEDLSQLLIEGCKFRFFDGNEIQTIDLTSSITDVVVRRSHFLDNYSDGDGHCQGLYIARVTNLLMEENVFDHNGWYHQDGGAIGPATVFNHNFYHVSNVNVVIRENVTLRPSSIGMKFTNYEAYHKITESLEIDNNLFVDCEVGINTYDESVQNYAYINVHDNVMTNFGQSQPTVRAIAWYTEFQDIASGAINGNLLINQSDTSIVSGSMGISFDNYIRSITISNNIVHNIYDAYGIYFDTTSNVSGLVFTGNKIRGSSGSNHYTVRSRVDISGLATFTGNQYFSNRSDGNRFFNNESALTDAQWVSATGDDFTWGDMTFPDATRNIENYMASIGETNTIAAFIAAQRAQDRYSWDSRLEADTVNDWIRAGFGLGLTGSRMSGPGSLGMGGTGAMSME